MGDFYFKEVIKLRSRSEAIEMFGGHVPSRGALDLVQRALDFGIDPSRHVRAAVESTEAHGRRKVIVKPDNPLGALKNAVTDRRFAGR
ncbi:MAG: hypothetical protein A2860_02240 [Candidatus Levybacteria bacterium RIFCSPHIGHO2_01_FULL_37_33]|nr:MAG: hypothetical protein A2860_02240 [Candidatus Levybacteria bacterium RIFCSPHIGHO2_01_FULL_37_33]OGH16818.1 MAG: hypothetical protein A3C97_02900 [Candidatus Levybacteria bacterium RIFCSPHIGHO2_02_FULL_37_11]OGH30247.1 MAG: hypothetical protein A3F30_03785 [Candidatus Levybacteria bacterium RIFCSPHIGHO2_12_FULL_37_12]OGH33125.1 MAG: hypothetical protein A2953_03080 [Candidatus Levybacteria bacterium RIFCSPLOWO2_01_FULL_36_54]